MKVEELLNANQLSAAVAEVSRQVKSHPTDLRLRTILFETLCFAGDYDRAERQLDVIGHQNDQSGIGIEVYRQLMKGEQGRERALQGGIRPSFLMEPPSHVEMHIQALQEIHAGNGDDARLLLQQAESRRFPVTGTLNGKPFSSLHDSDDILAPILECFINGVYTWLPFEHIRKLKIESPRYLRDTLWIQASVETCDRPSGPLFLPVLYFDTHKDANDMVKLGRLTEWRAVADGVVAGVGQRTLLVDEEEIGLLEIRDLEIAERKPEIA